MEKGIMSFREDTLMGELGAWNLQEQRFRDLFSADALLDDAFLKLKLKEFDRVWYTYRKQINSPDDRAMLNMLDFQRAKLQKQLYPNWLSRGLMRGVRHLQFGLWAKVSAIKVRPVFDMDFGAFTTEAVKEKAVTESISAVKMQEKAPQQAHDQSPRAARRAANKTRNGKKNRWKQRR